MSLKFESKSLKIADSLRIDFFFVSIILIATFVIYLHHFIPDVPTWSTGLFKLSPLRSSTVQTFFYMILVKVTPVLLLTVWFMSNRHWWRYAILAPLSYLLYQLITMIFEELGLVYENEPLAWGGMVALYLGCLLFVERMIGYRSDNLDTRYYIGSENVHLIPRSRKNKERIGLVKRFLLSDDIKRSQLNLVYREYDFLKKYDSKIDQELKTGSVNSFNSRAFKSIKWFLEIFVFLFVLALPVVFNGYRLIESGVTQLKIFNVVIDDHGFRDLQTLAWLIASKLIVLLPVTIWFFTSRYWWKYFLLIPFSIYLFQILELFKSEQPIDGVELKLALPVVLIIMGIMIVVSMRVRNFLNLKEFYSVMESKINITIKRLSEDFEPEHKSQLKYELTELIKNHKHYAPDEYLGRLKKMKKRLEQLSEEG